MKPTQECEIVGMVVSARRSLVDVVGLQPIAVAAASDGAGASWSLIQMKLRGTGWDCFGKVGRTDRMTVIALEYDPHLAGAENL